MYSKFFKRFIDIILSLLALVIALPLLLIISVVLLITGEHQVFYLQKRIGKQNRSFFILKFATMLKNSEKLKGGMHTTRNDPRVLPFGRFLRKTKLNEIPQIGNILIGDLSIVGPRPLVTKTFEPYPDHVKKAIYNIKPGLTGIGSIVFRDEEKLLSGTHMPTTEYYARFIAPYKGELELWYQRHLSFTTDFLLVFITAWVVFRPKSNLVYKVFKDLPHKPSFLD